MLSMRIREAMMLFIRVVPSVAHGRRTSRNLGEPTLGGLMSEVLDMADQASVHAGRR